MRSSRYDTVRLGGRGPSRDVTRPGTLRLAAVAGLALLASQPGRVPGIELDDSVPEGFESLAGARILLVDVVFADAVVGRASVEVDGAELVLAEPADVLGSLPGVTSAPVLVAAASGRLPTNVDRLCQRPGDPVGCGTVAAEPVAVLLDEDALELVVFVAPEYRSVLAVRDEAPLEPPGLAPSAILGLDASLSRSQDAAWRLGVRGETWLGYGPGYLRAHWSSGSAAGRSTGSPAGPADTGTGIHSAALVHVDRGAELTLGTFALRAGSTELDLLGVRFATSGRGRSAGTGDGDSPLTVQLDRRSLVQLIVDDRVYYSDTLPAGRIGLDTTGLPDGVGEVEVRIVDPVSGERRERRPFVRSALLPPRGRTLAEFATGVPLARAAGEALPRAARIGIGSVRLLRRTGHRSALGFGLARLGPLALVRPELVLVGGPGSLELSASVGTHRARGLGARAAWRGDALFGALIGEWFDAGDAGDAVGNADAPGMFEPSVADRDVGLDATGTTWMPRTGARIGLVLDRAFGHSALGFQMLLRRDGGAPWAVGLGLGYRYRLFERVGLRGSLSARARHEDGAGVELGVDLRLGFGRGASVTSLVAGAAGPVRGAGRVPARAGGSDASGVLGVEHRVRGEPRPGWRLAGGGWASAGTGASSLGLDAGVDHERFAADVQGRWSEREHGQSELDASLRASTRLVLDGGGLTVAGPDTVHSGLVVDVDGEPLGAGYDVLADGVRVATGVVGRPTFVPLPAFSRYRIRLAAHGLAASALDGQGLEVTLYPGGVARLSVHARARRLVIASVVDPDGALLGGAVVEHVDGPFALDDDALLQVEAGAGEILAMRSVTGSVCRVRLPDALGDEDVVVLAEPLVCL